MCRVSETPNVFHAVSRTYTFFSFRPAKCTCETESERRRMGGVVTKESSETVLRAECLFFQISSHTMSVEMEEAQRQRREVSLSYEAKNAGDLTKMKEHDKLAAYHGFVATEVSALTFEIRSSAVALKKSVQESSKSKEELDKEVDQAVTNALRRLAVVAMGVEDIMSTEAADRLKELNTEVSENSGWRAMLHCVHTRAQRTTGLSFRTAIEAGPSATEGRA